MFRQALIWLIFVGAKESVKLILTNAKRKHRWSEWQPLQSWVEVFEYIHQEYLEEDVFTDEVRANLNTFRQVVEARLNDIPRLSYFVEDIAELEQLRLQLRLLYRLV